MPITSGFYDSVNHQPTYSAAQFSELIGSLVTEGVFENIGQRFLVTPVSGSSTGVYIGTGRCWFDNVWMKNDSLYSFSLQNYSPASGQSRIDAIYIYVDRANRTAGFDYKNGDPSSNPSKPLMMPGEYPIAYVRRTGSAITANDIENTVGTTACPFITATLPINDITNVFNAWRAAHEEWVNAPRYKRSSLTIYTTPSQTVVRTFSVPAGLSIVTVHFTCSDNVSFSYTLVVLSGDGRFMRWAREAGSQDNDGAFQFLVNADSSKSFQITPHVTGSSPTAQMTTDVTVDIVRLNPTSVETWE